MGIPSTVQIGPLRFRVIADKEELRAVRQQYFISDETVGLMHGLTQRILLDPDVAPDEIADTLLHEVLHACFHTSRAGLGEKREEKAVRAVCTLLLDTLRRNPELVAFLLNEAPLDEVP